MNDHIVCKLLDNIRIRSGMYIGEPSVRLLRMFIAGYLSGAYDFADVHSDYQYRNFQRWVEKKYDIKETIGWDKILIMIAGSDEAAFDLFWTLWDEFVKEISTTE